MLSEYFRFGDDDDDITWMRIRLVRFAAVHATLALNVLLVLLVLSCVSQW